MPRCCWCRPTARPCVSGGHPPRALPQQPFHAELLKAGELAQIPFEFNWAAWRLPAGAHLRVVIAPLNSPKYQKNYNTGGRIGYERLEDARIAHIRLLHDAQHASRLIVPLAAANGRP